MTSLNEELTQRAIELSRLNFTTFKQVVFRRYIRALHLDLLDRALTQVSRYVETNGESGISRLIIEMPPRHGKTRTTSQLYPAWHLGRNPDHRIMLVSYGATLADKNSRAARNLLSLPYYKAIFPHIRLSEDSRAVDSWDLAGCDGGVDALGIGGGAAGKGAHILCIDDPVKNRAEAESETYRERNWEAFTSDLYTRLEPFGAIILMATRWQMEDLTGRALQMEEEGWKRLRLPAFAEVDDPLHREIGDALWPERFPQERLQRIESALGEYEFASLYQQRPIPRGNSLFDTANIQIIDYVPECIKIVRFYDLAATEKSRSDYTAGVLMGVTKDEEFIILHVYHAQKELPDIQEAIVQRANIDGVKVPIRLEAEKAGIIQLQYLMRDHRMRAYTINAVPPVGDKWTRSQPFAARVKAGRVKMVRGSWNQPYLDELALFPQGKRDDQVDATSGAYEMLANGNQPSASRASSGTLYKSRSDTHRDRPRR